MMTESEREAAVFDVTMFHKMMEVVKLVDWENLACVQDMINLGWEYNYHNGMVDKTIHYVRYEEDTICFKKNNASVQINMTTGTVVIQDLHSCEEHYYGHPTVFLTKEELLAIYGVVDNIKILLESVILSNK